MKPLPGVKQQISLGLRGTDKKLVGNIWDIASTELNSKRLVVL